MHLRLDAFAGQRFGGGQGLAHHRTPGDEGHIAALARNEAAIEWQRRAIVRPPSP